MDRTTLPVSKIKAFEPPTEARQEKAAKTRQQIGLNSLTRFPHHK